MLKQRLITAAVLVPLTVWAVLALESRWFALVLAVVLAGGAWEWAALAGMRSSAARVAYAAVMLGLMYGGYALSAARPDLLPIVLIVVAGFWLLATSWVWRYPRGAESWGKSRLIRALMGGAILFGCWLATIALHANLEQGPAWVLFLMILMWLADSGAYLVGRRWGRTKLAPQVSPGKTWEGVAGGLLGASVGALFATWWLETGPLAGFLLVCMVTVVFSVIGDLTESLLKRNAGVKDSGRLLPGHGGILDRIDSLTAAAPVFVLGLLLLGVFR
ncbi:MAG: hypothetical protein AMJ69_06500 [Gammaproteobacteria bacterium SG8_47]|nr:MAG: hypothetical protein AMJ69_06500 [Gammaproteobacteria bacterium SG8_47]